jgi:hypothetical protein
MSIEEIVGLFLIPALAGGVSGWVYWRAAGRPRPIPAPRETAG